MSDVPQLREALEDWDGEYTARPDHDVYVFVAAARRLVEVAETSQEPDYDRAKRQMLNYLDDELFLGLESALEGIVDWEWLVKAIVDAAVGGRRLVDPQILEME